MDFTNGQIFTNLNFTRRWICFKNNALTRFEVTYVKFQSVDGTIPCFNKLKYLDIRGLRAISIDPYLLTEMPALETLLAGRAIPTGFFNETNASIIFHKNTKLKRLDLSQLNMQSVPLKALTPLHELHILNLSGNRLSTINECQELISLTSLDVTDNQLTYLPYSILKHLEKNHERVKDNHPFLNLTANPLLCSCETIDILDDYYNSSIEISHLEDGLLTCVIATYGSHVWPVKHALQKLITQCHKTDMKLILIAFFLYCVSVAITMFFSALVNQRWKIRYAWYKIEQYFFKEEAANKTMFEFDAFISYSSRNRQWVESCLVMNLEQCGYSLCLDYMHFIPGECIMDNIVSAVENSRHTLLVVTPSYIKSGWCDFEVRCAQAHHIRLRQSGIIAIVFPKVIQALKRHYRPSLSKLLDTVTYLEWPENRYAKMVFWIRLKQALGRPVQNLTT